MRESSHSTAMDWLELGGTQTTIQTVENHMSHVSFVSLLRSPSGSSDPDKMRPPASHLSGKTSSWPDREQ